ncbi:D-alanyl-D-alanine carboxypeptidase [Kiloniella laminariae]|uniref:D-alanyl-D-alanine carboxypeptidase n=1 Tax=Kiloniella laminariae TaxID=454162 RepID=A0ABT4LE84_9PROT|nr:D-alanyl-D-alanine carboxypeptidase family protein [Kiloniella laminariae]MCZ4279408.1 D-alanyl-D-alanine carboxypeptidase [Kiloniella laminariae]
MNLGLKLISTMLLTLFVLMAPAHAKYASIVLDAETGEILYSRNADVKNYPASLTKMMTLYMAFDALEKGKLKMEQKLPVSKRASGMAPSKLGLAPGSTITTRDVIMSLVTKSANDAAVVMAEAIGGKETTFANMMTSQARKLGMSNTTFRNASGLPNRGQLSTARDMATLAKALMRDFPQYYGLFSTQSFSYKNRTYNNHNKLLASYQGTDGIKTGYTNASGFNLVASVLRNDRRLIGVVFGGKTGRSRDRHMKDILDKSFKQVGVTRVAKLPAVPKPNPLRESDVAALAPPPVTPTPRPVLVNASTSPAPGQIAALATTTGLAIEENGEETSNVSDDSWGIQVGAFSDYEPAKMAAAQAKAQITSHNDATQVHIQQVDKADGSLYRARLKGLDEVAARNACRELKEKRMSCVAVPPGLF